MKTAWGEIKNQIKTWVPDNTFSLWIKPIAYLQAEKGAVVLGCPNRFSRDWVIENYLDLIREKFNDIAGKPVDVRLKVQHQKRIRKQLLRISPQACSCAITGRNPSSVYL